jgi:hypothetical protein
MVKNHRDGESRGVGNVLAGRVIGTKIFEVIKKRGLLT